MAGLATVTSWMATAFSYPGRLGKRVLDMVPPLKRVTSPVGNLVDRVPYLRRVMAYGGGNIIFGLLLLWAAWMAVSSMVM